MASNVNITQKYALDQLWSMRCSELKEILRANDKSVSGTKQILVARCYALNTDEDDRKIATPDERPNKDSDNVDNFNPLLALDSIEEIGYIEINLTAKGRQWQTDLRKFPPCNFHQVFEYLVNRTKKYGAIVMKGDTYKKMKSYQFFQEGHIKSYEIACGYGLVWVKSKVIASMKHEMYRAIIICKDNGDILYGACECPAGLGLKGAGKCNHVGGILFAIHDFNERGLHQKTEKVSCTSKLNGWIVPRNLTVKAQPLKDIKVKKIQFGKQDVNNRPTVNTFEPRAPQDRSVDTYALRRLYENMEEHAPNSGFFLYHDPPSMLEHKHDFTDNIESTNVAMNMEVSTTVHVGAAAANIVVKPKLLPISLIEINSEIQDDQEIDQTFVDKFVVPSCIENDSLSDAQIEQVEHLTKGQADNVLWTKLHKYKATASNFGKIIKCSKNPDGLLKSMFYSDPFSAALSYGKQNEFKAVEAYKQYMYSKSCNVQVESVGLMLAKDRPGLGASLDGLVIDPSAEIKRGGLEVKCPYSKAKISVREACKDKTFFLKYENDEISLKENNNYFYQVQGQMYVANLKWVDFVVWFGEQEDSFVQRIIFNANSWFEKCLPALDLFYKWAVVPELLTRRVERKLKLLSKDQWLKLKSEISD